MSGTKQKSHFKKSEKNNLGLHGVFKKRTINHYKKINVDKRIITSIYSCVDIN